VAIALPPLHQELDPIIEPRVEERMVLPQNDYGGLPDFTGMVVMECPKKW